MAGDYLSSEHLAAMEEGRIWIGDVVDARAKRSVHVGERFSLVPDGKDFIPSPLFMDNQGKPLGRSVTTSLIELSLPDGTPVDILCCVDELLNPIGKTETLNGTTTRRPLFLAVYADNVPRGSHLGCRIHYKDRNGTEQSKELYSDVQGRAINFTRERGVSTEVEPWQLAIDQSEGRETITLKQAVSRLGLEAEFYIQEPQRIRRASAASR